MFWVIFDTSTKRDYYRDVHNILALPIGTTIRYDYNDVHFSAEALAAAQNPNTAGQPVLLAYAQTRTFKKGNADPNGPLPFDDTLWIATRIASLRHIKSDVGRYYFDLELREYPDPNEGPFKKIMQELAGRDEVPFAKWVVISNLDEDFRALVTQNHANNWAKVIDRLGNFPSQFAGDTFWRVADVAAGSGRVALVPSLVDLAASGLGQGVEAVFPLNELDTLAIQIQSWMPEAGEEPKGKEPASPPKVVFETLGTCALAAFNGRNWTVRRYASEWIDGEVAGSDRIDSQVCDIKIKTSSESSTNGYPTGPELNLKFRVAKKEWRSYWSMLAGLAALVSAGVGAAIVKDNLAVGIVLFTLGGLFGLATYYFWTGRIKLPGAK